MSIRKIPRKSNCSKIETKLFHSIRYNDGDDLNINLEESTKNTKIETKIINKKKLKSKVDIPDLILPLKTHQHEAVKWMLEIENKVRNEPNPYNIRGGILSDAPGLGKTLSALCLCIKSSFDNSNEETGFPNLIICPKIVIEEWCNSITKFFGDKYLFLSIKSNDILDITYDKLKKYKFVITNYEFILSMMKEYYNDSLLELKSSKEFQLREPFKHNELINKKGRELLVDINWNRIICDESHRMNNSKSLVFLSLINLISNKRWCLTGTPIRNYEKDIYHQFLFMGYNNFICKKSKFSYNQYRTDKLNKHVLKRAYKDVEIIMPEYEEKSISIELTENEKKIYENVHNNLKNEYKRFSNGYVSFGNVLHLFLRLRQMCVSSYAMIRQLKKNIDNETIKEIEEISDENFKLKDMRSIKNISTNDLANKIIPNELYEWIMDKNGSAGYMSSKISAVVEILKEIEKRINKEKVLIFTCFTTHMDIIKNRIENELKTNVLLLNGSIKENERQEIISLFKESNDYNIMIINYKIGSEGLNLMEANNVILCENWWCPSVMEQAKHRAYRIGQKKKVYFYNIITKNTIEDKIKKICDNTEELSKSFMNDIFDTFTKKDYGLNNNTLKKIIF
jgi:SNF2 family DNA or RNA helicase